MDTTNNSCALVQFAKSPDLGKVKTRMSAVLSEQQCVDLHCNLTSLVFNNLLGVDGCALQLWVSSNPQHSFFQGLVGNTRASIFQQSGNGLGERLSMAAQQTLDNYAYVILVGSDCPFIDAAYIEAALSQLRSGKAAVIGPASDGGYVLLGLRLFHHRLFEDIDWGSERVFQQTCGALKELGWDYAELDVLPDIDRPEDLILIEHLIS